MVSDSFLQMMNALFTTFQSVNGIFWQPGIYFSQLITGHAQPTDCANVCLNIQTGICQFFVFSNGMCYLGRSDITNGTLSQLNSSVIIYSLNGICEIIHNIQFFLLLSKWAFTFPNLGSLDSWIRANLNFSWPTKTSKVKFKHS